MYVFIILYENNFILLCNKNSFISFIFRFNFSLSRSAIYDNPTNWSNNTPTQNFNVYITAFGQNSRGSGRRKGREMASGMYFSAITMRFSLYQY